MHLTSKARFLPVRIRQSKLPGEAMCAPKRLLVPSFARPGILHSELSVDIGMSYNVAVPLNALCGQNDHKHVFDTSKGMLKHGQTMVRSILWALTIC